MACASLVILLLVPVSANAGVRVSPAVADGGPTTVVISAPVAGETSPQIATGEFHTCALLNGGTVRCWGYNDEGQLGDGTDNDSVYPVQVLTSGTAGSDPVPLAGVTQITVGNDHSCALLNDGTVRCWGYNYEGQLGDGTDNDSVYPVQVLTSGTAGSDPVPLAGVTQITVGNEHSCALLNDGTVRCWGYNYEGQLGDGTDNDSVYPVQVLTSGTAGSDPVPLAGVTQITVGSEHSCALLNDGTVRCWGDNWAGQLGDGTDNDSEYPVRVLTSGTEAGSETAVPLAGVTQLGSLSSYSDHTCALLEDGTVRCWGLNRVDSGAGTGQLGDGTTDNRSHPVRVLTSGTEADGDAAELGGVTQVTAGWRHTCALLTDGTVRCWGYNDEGQLGDGTDNDSVYPVQVLASGTAGSDPVPLAGVTQISASADTHTCALLEDGTVRCWGDNWAGQLGDGTTDGSLLPVQVLTSGTAISSPVAFRVRPLAALTPEFDTPVRTAGGFTVVVTNYNGNFGWAATSDHGTLTAGTPQGTRFEGVVTGLAPGQQATVTVITTRVGYDSGSAIVIGVATGGADAAPVEVQTVLPSVTCSPLPAQVGSLVTCTVTGGDAGIDILWRAAYNPTFAESGVTLDASGAGTFSFVVPAAAFGQPITVELVDWTAPMPLGVAGGPVPTSVPSGEGPAPVWPLGLLALAGGLALRRGSRPGRSAWRVG